MPASIFYHLSSFSVILKGMKGFCGIAIDEDKTFISFAGIKKGYPIFLEEIEIPLHFKENNLLDHLKDNSDIFDRKISDKEQALSLKVEKIFLNLPWNMENCNIVEEVISLKEKKKIDYKDINSAKRHLEDIHLGWDDFCIHHFISNYQVEGNSYQTIPLGVVGQKIKLKSFIVWIKDKLRKDVEDIFDNFWGRRFGGFVAEWVSDFYAASGKIVSGYGSQTTVIDDKLKNLIIINIGYRASYIIIFHGKERIYTQQYDFGLKKIFENISENFSFSLGLAEEIFERYVIFKDAVPLKEINIKYEGRYVNISLHTINSFVENYIKENLDIIIKEIIHQLKDDTISINFLGRLNVKEGVLSLLQKNVPYKIKILSSKDGGACSYGCIKHKITHFLESYYNEEPLFKRLHNVYREYF